MRRNETNETPAQRRARERVELVKALEAKTRDVVEAEQLVAQLRAAQGALREQLLHAVSKPRKSPPVPEIILDAARAVESGATTAADVARALNITIPCARMRLRRAVDANLVDHVGHGKYGSPLRSSQRESVSQKESAT